MKELHSNVCVICVCVLLALVLYGHVCAVRADGDHMAHDAGLLLARPGAPAVLGRRGDPARHAREGAVPRRVRAPERDRRVRCVEPLCSPQLCPLITSVLLSSSPVVPGMLIVAESVSSLKRTLARILVLIVAVGFGYVKCAHPSLSLQHSTI